MVSKFVERKLEFQTRLPEQKADFELQRTLCRAKAGNPKAQLIVAAYHLGYQTSHHGREARKWFGHAAISSDPYARLEGRYMIAVDVLNRDSRTSWRERQQAIALLHEVADSRHFRAPDAQLVLGMLLVSSPLVPRDMAKGMDYLVKAAGKKPAEAGERLGEIYLYGEEGIKADARQAKHWLELSAKAGSAASQYMCGLIGTVGALDSYATGMKWLRMAAAQGYKPAIEELKEAAKQQAAWLSSELSTDKPVEASLQLIRH